MPLLVFMPQRFDLHLIRLLGTSRFILSIPDVTLFFLKRYRYLPTITQEYVGIII